MSLCLLALPAGASAGGPLKVSRENPRYFEDTDGKIVYLTGSHTWNNLQDIAPAEAPAPFDFTAYLDFLSNSHHNFIRLWRFEVTNWNTTNKETQTFTNHRSLYAIAPHPWKRTGPGIALDGLPKFNLDEFDPEYFQRLRERVEAASNRKIYVSVMLFEGFCIWALSDGWQWHPFHAANNVNRINGDQDGDGKGTETHTLQIPEVTRRQEEYVRKVIDTLNDLDNVLYEIANESGAASYEWQAHLVKFTHKDQRQRPKQHPVGITFLIGPNTGWLDSDDKLFSSPAAWISPSRSARDGYAYRTNPPPTDGRKVIMADTDHFFGIGGSAEWVWMTTTRGLNPIFMDPWDNKVLGKPDPKTWDPLRQSMGVARKLLNEHYLRRMVPQGGLASSGYCLAEPGRAYLVFVPKGGKVELDLTAANGKLAVDWIDPVTGDRRSGDSVTGGGKSVFTPPVDGPIVLQILLAEP